MRQRQQFAASSGTVAADHEGTYNKQRSPLEKSCGIIYRKSIFSRDELCILQAEIRRHMKQQQLQDECSSSIAQKRRGTTLDSTAVLEILKSGSLHQLVEKSVGAPVELASGIPVEIRVYEKQGAGMAWHVDDVLYDPPQIEVVWTLENTSDCQTLWKNSNNGVVNGVETEPNSAILLLAGNQAPEHCVTQLHYGTRTILKFAYIRQGAQFRVGQHKNQFVEKKKKNRNGKKARNKKGKQIMSKKRR